MENGYVLLNTIVLLLIGIAGAGKTSFCHMLFGERPPTVRKSTPLALSSIRAMSFCRAAVSQMENTSIVWQRVSPSKLNSLITDGIKAFRDLKSGTVSSRALTGEQPLVAHSRSDELSTERSPVSPSDLDDADTSRSLTSVVHTSSSVRTSPLSDIDQLFELDEVKELLQLVSQSKGSFEIFRKEWLYISDTGGQPKFHELLPTFVRHVSAVAFFIKLNEKFSSRPMIAYYSREGASICEPYQSSQTNLEVIQNCLQAMQTRCIVEGSTKCPELFFVGTHRDLENVYEPLESKNAQLLKLLRQDHVFAKHLAYYSLGKTDQLIFPVNSKEPSTEDEKVVERFRQSIMEKCHKHQRKIPLKWFVLESLLQKLADDGVISYEKCLDVANRLGMDEPRLKAALEYLVQLNIFEFFPHVLSKVVFTTSQVLLTKMTELIEYAHILLNIDLSHSACTSEDQEFRDHGYISEKFLKQKRFSSHYISGLFEAKDLLKLLENRLVVSKQSKDIYIMTAALPELSSEKVDDHHMTVSQMSTHVPIAVHYPSCLFPIGIFTSLVSHLQTKSSWKILMNEDTGKPEYFYKNCIDFVIDTAEVSANVTLIYTHQWIELHTCIYGEKSQAHVLVRMLFDGLKHAAEVQKYSHIVPKLAFLCPGEKGTSQISAKCKHAFPHLASITPNDFLQCTHNKRIRYKITDDYRHWTESPTGTYTYSILLLPTCNPCIHFVDKRINDPSNSGVASTVTVVSYSV